MKTFAFLLGAALCVTRISVAEQTFPRVFGLPPGALARASKAFATNDPAVAPAIARLLEEAKEALKAKPRSVMEKPQIPDSGDKHDYMSQAPYFWLDPAKPDGKPYIRKDGQRNPESRDEHSDSPRLGATCIRAETLALAWFLTRDDAFADQAAKLLRGWFLDPAKRMNPNFNFAQAIPGVTNGRGTGMIESTALTRAMDAASLLADSPHWTQADRDGFAAWMSAFLEWAQTSKNGKDEAAARNNHGTWYDVQIVHLALFLGCEDLAEQTLEAAKTKRIALQIKPDGTQPLELDRVDSFGYSRFNLIAHFALATLGEHAGVWEAFDFLLGYAEQPEKEWPYEHGKKAARSLDRLLWRAAAVHGDARYWNALHALPDWQKRREALFLSAN